MRIMISQINLVFQKFLKRKINQKEIDLINNQIKKENFCMDKLVHSILTSKGYTLLCLKVLNQSLNLLIMMLNQ